MGKKEDKQRGMAATANRSQLDNSLNLQSAQMSAKNASIEQQTQAFGGSQKDAQNVISVEVVPDQMVQTYNEISSYSVDKLNCAETVSKLSTILGAYSQEIDFSVDLEANKIENGCVFINNYYSVFFAIYVEKDEANKVTRFEFRRQSGDALASSKFLGDVKTLFFGKSDDQKEENTLIGLELNANDFVGNDLDENAENYLYGQLVKNKAVNKTEDAIDHKILRKTLIEKGVLLHDDIAVVRASLLILKKMANSKEEFGLTSNAALFALLSQIMMKQRGLIQQYVVDLLSTLAQSEKEWKLEDSDKVSLSKSLKEYQTRFSNKKYFDEKIVDVG